MGQREITKEVINYFNSKQWQELMRMLTQTEEEIYHIHMFWENSIESQSLCKLIERYFAHKGMPLDRKIDLTTSGPDIIGLHSVHPHHFERSLYVPAIDMYWRRFNPNVILKPADPSKLGEEGKNIIGWGKKHMDAFYGKFDFKCVGPREEKEIDKYFQSAHWKKTLRLVDSGLYTHVHANVEINFDPWILKTLAMDALREVGWKVNHVIPCVYHYLKHTGYEGKIVFLNSYPEEVWDICWEYNPDVIIRPAAHNFWGSPLEDGDIAFDAWTKSYLDELLAKDKYQTLSDAQIEEILEQV